MDVRVEAGLSAVDVRSDTEATQRGSLITFVTNEWQDGDRARQQQPPARVAAREGRHPVQVRRRDLRHLSLPDRAAGSRTPTAVKAEGAQAPDGRRPRRRLPHGLPDLRQRRRPPFRGFRAGRTDGRSRAEPPIRARPGSVPCRRRIRTSSARARTPHPTALVPPFAHSRLPHDPPPITSPAPGAPRAQRRDVRGPQPGRRRATSSAPSQTPAPKTSTAPSRP